MLPEWRFSAGLWCGDTECLKSVQPWLWLFTVNECLLKMLVDCVLWLWYLSDVMFEVMAHVK